MHNLFIVNPKAGKRNFIKKLLSDIDSYFKYNQDETCSIEICETGDQATEIARKEALKGNKVRIFACGGDGTAFKVLNGVAGFQNVILGIIPKGTGNDFLKSFGDITPFYSIEKQINGSVIKIDAIKAGRHYALNQASMGMDAAVCYHKDKFNRIPLVNGQAAYIISLIYCFFSSLKHQLAVKIGDGETVKGDYLFAVGANGRYCGGGFKSAPLALTSDGLLDCFSVKAVSRFKILSLLSKYSQGRHLDLDIVEYKQTDKIHIKSNKPAYVNLDGEVIMAEEITFTVAPRMVNFIVPNLSVSPIDNQKKMIKGSKKTVCYQAEK